jgi:hypothetical protein
MRGRSGTSSYIRHALRKTGLHGLHRQFGKTWMHRYSALCIFFGGMLCRAFRKGEKRENLINESIFLPTAAPRSRRHCGAQPHAVRFFQRIRQKRWRRTCAGPISGILNRLECDKTIRSERVTKVRLRLEAGPAGAIPFLAS